MSFTAAIATARAVPPTKKSFTVIASRKRRLKRNLMSSQQSRKMSLHLTMRRERGPEQTVS
jgi:hypothetical protein